MRGALLLPLCVLAVHQLRYYLAYGSKASAHLAASGHAYLSDAEPFALLCVALAVGALLGRLARTGARTQSEASLGRAWAMCAATLLALYCGQELIEGMVASGHAAGLAGIVGYGGWIAVPAAAAIGGALALALRAAERLVALVGSLHARRACCPAVGPGQRFTLTADRDWRLVPLSGVAGSRAPPRALSL